MKQAIATLAGYAEEVTGKMPRLTPVPEALESLPAYFGSLYEAVRAEILDRNYLLLIFKGQVTPTPAEIAGHYRVASRQGEDQVAFVLERLESFARQRLIRYRVPFIVPGRQMYLPQFIADFRERGRNGVNRSLESTTHLSGPAQVLVLFHLQQATIHQAMSLRSWSSLLGYSPMTATRIGSELLQAKLCTVEQVGRSSILHLDNDRRALWTKALSFLRSPVRDCIHVRLLGKDHPSWRKAGMAALSHLTMLASDTRPVFAMSASEYARALLQGRFSELPFPDDNTMTVERWRYRPELLCGDQGETVDRLSLYLSLRDDPDERVQAAIEELLEDIKW